MDLYHNNVSVCAKKVRLVLHEKGLQPVEHHLNLRAGEQTHPEYLRLNPKGVVPTLVDHDQPIIESTVICEYLEDTYPQSPLRPEDPVARARMRLWTLLPDTGLHTACGVTSFAIAFRHNWLALPEDEREQQLAAKPDPAIRENVRRAVKSGLDAPKVRPSLRFYDNVLSQMSRQLNATPWLAGEEYSLADVALLPYVCRLEALSFSWLWDGERASIGQWLERCKRRRNYSGIANYLDPDYLELMDRSGREACARVRAILAE